MTLKQKRRTTQRAVRLLTDPDPRYVSIVDHGANQTPWNAVKRETLEGEGDMATKKAKTKLPIRKRRNTSVVEQKTASQAGAVSQLLFLSDKYKSEKDVEEWLDEHDWDKDTYKITENEDGDFVAKSNDPDDQELDDIRTVKVENSVFAEVGVVVEKDDKATDEDTEEDVEKSQKESRNIFKFDWWSAHLSGEESTSDIIKDAMSDGIPPGFEEVVLANTLAMANALKNNSGKDALIKSATDMADIIYKINEVFTDILEDDKATDEEKSAATKFTEAVAKAVANSKADNSEGDDLQTSATKSEEGDTSDDIKALRTQIEELTGKLTEAIGKVDKATAEAKSATERADKAEKTVKELANEAPVRKSSELDFADDEEGDTDVDNKRKEARKAHLCAQLGHVF